MSVPSARLPRGSWRAGWTRERTQGASQPFERASRGISLPSRCLKRPRAPAAATPGSTPAAPSSPPPPWTARSPDGASRSSAPSRACGRPPSPTRLRGPRRPRRPRGRWRARRGGTAVASCAPEPVAGLGRLGEPHRDGNVGGRGAIPLAPTRTTHGTDGPDAKERPSSSSTHDRPAPGLGATGARPRHHMLPHALRHIAGHPARDHHEGRVLPARGGSWRGRAPERERAPTTATTALVAGRCCRGPEPAAGRGFHAQIGVGDADCEHD